MNRKHPLKKIVGDFFDYNVEAAHAKNDATATNATKTADENFTATPETVKVTDENCTPETENEDSVSIGLNALNQILTENSSLQTENKMLQESIKRFENLKEENDKNFKKIQVQLDKLFDLLRSNIRDNDTSTIHNSNIDEKIAQSGIQFPINSVEKLQLLEDKLDMGFEKVLIKKFSSMCGTSGTQKIAKIGLQLTRALFTDDLLYQFTWKGIKGCTKIPFITNVKIRHLFFKIMQLADSSCSAKDADSFLQNSAIKHSGQRIKRKFSEVKISSNQKKQKIESSFSENLETQNHEIQEDNNENVEYELHANENQIDNTADTKRTTSKVTVLSDVKVNNKVIDLNHDTKMMNISSGDLLTSQVWKKMEGASEVEKDYY